MRDTRKYFDNDPYTMVKDDLDGEPGADSIVSSWKRHPSDAFVDPFLGGFGLVVSRSHSDRV